jgi:hypothetical protein
MSSAARDFAERVASSFGTTPRRHGREFRAPCPVHEADGSNHTPSFAVWDKPGGGVAWKCMTGCASNAIRSALKARGVPVSSGAAVSIEELYAQRHSAEGRRLDQLQKAADIVLGNSAFASLDTPAHTYLQSRGLGEWCRLPTIRAAFDPGTKSAALAAVICDLSSLRRPQLRTLGVSMLYLNNDGTPKMVGGKKFRSILGTSKGFGVPLVDGGSDTLVVGEGVESTLAAMTLLGRLQGCAVLSAANLPFLIVPEWVRRVTIAADNDAAGIKGAEALYAGMRAVGVACEIVKWGDAGSGWDACDELKKRKNEL